MPKIAKVIIPIALDKEFDYSFSFKNLEKGMRVLVDFNRKKKVGLVVDIVSKSKIKYIKPVIDVLDSVPVLDSECLHFARLLGSLYPYSKGEFLFMMLPSYLKKSRKSDLIQPPKRKKKPETYKIKFIKADTFLERYKLLKPEIAKKLKKGSVLICFPQLAYLEKAKDYLQKDFKGKIKILHSQEKEKVLFLNWQQSRQKSLILGTRVSIFYHPPDLELIIVEQENSPYYFQEEKPFHNLLDVTMFLCRQKRVDLILSADFPSLAAYKLIKDKKIDLIDISGGIKDIKVVNISESRKSKIIGPVLSELLREKNQKGKKSLVLWNRKGFARVISCSSCGHVLKCPHCSAFLHSSLKVEEGICPYCQRKTTLPTLCNKCKQGYFKSTGFGIERIESVLKRIFPEVRIDNWQQRCSDTQITLSTSKILSFLYEGIEFDSGFVLDIDVSLARPDYAATFEIFLYLRELTTFCRDNLFVFTRNKDYYLFQYLNQPWQNFYDKELTLREQSGLPPFGLIAKIVIRGKNKNALLKRTQDLYNKLEKKFSDIYGPLEEQPFKLRDKFRYYLVVKTKNSVNARKDIKKALKDFRSSSLKLAASLR